MKTMDDPFETLGWSPAAQWVDPVPVPQRMFPAKDTDRPRFAVVSGKLPNASAGRVLPHALMQLSRVLVDGLVRKGYDVLLVDPLETEPRLDRPVDFLAGELRMFDAVRPAVRDGGTAVWIGTRPHWRFESAAVRRRLAEVSRKKGFQPFAPPWELGEWNRGADDASAVLAYDATTYRGRIEYVGEIGNSYLRTLAAIGDVPVRAPGFLWLGTGSLVRKGLDLALEPFVDEPGLDLSVAGPLHWADQRDFVWHYREELFHTPNIHPIGFVPPASATWQEMLAEHSFVLMPSCAEATVGALLDAMVCGLIPIATPECGVAIDDFGIALPEPSAAAVRQAVETAAGLSATQRRERSAAARAFALEHYSARMLSRRVEQHLTAVLARADELSSGEGARCR